MILNQII